MVPIGFSVLSNNEFICYNNVHVIIIMRVCEVVWNDCLYKLHMEFI